MQEWKRKQHSNIWKAKIRRAESTLPLLPAKKQWKFLVTCQVKMTNNRAKLDFVCRNVWVGFDTQTKTIRLESARSPTSSELWPRFSWPVTKFHQKDFENYLAQLSREGGGGLNCAEHDFYAILSNLHFWHGWVPPPPVELGQLNQIFKIV